MAHWSENAQRLRLEKHRIEALADAVPLCSATEPSVYFFWFPAFRTDEIANQSEEAYTRLAQLCGQLHKDSVVAILTTPRMRLGCCPFLRINCIFSFGLR